MVFPIMLLLLTCIIISAIPSSCIITSYAAPPYAAPAPPYAAPPYADPYVVFQKKAAGDYPSYEECAPYCGNSTIQYPFGMCGLLDAYCDEANQAFLHDEGPSSWRVLGEITKSSHFTQTLQITPFYIYPGYDWLLKGGFFNLSDAYMVGSIVKCRQPPADILVNNSKKLDCTKSKRYCFFYPQAGFQIPSCDNYNVIVPRDKSYNISNDKKFNQLRQRGFQITWSIQDYTCDACKTSGGRCYSRFGDYIHYKYDTYYTYCICPNDDVHYSDCDDGSVIQYGKRLSAKDMAAIFFALCAVFSIVVVSCIMVRRQSCCCQRSSSEQSIRAFMDPVDSRPPSVENFLNYYSS